MPSPMPDYISNTILLARSRVKIVFEYSNGLTFSMCPDTGVVLAFGMIHSRYLTIGDDQTLKAQEDDKRQDSNGV